MQIKVVTIENDDGRRAVEYHFDGKCRLHFCDGESSIIDLLYIEKMLHQAYEAGKSGEEIYFSHEEGTW